MVSFLKALISGALNSSMDGDVQSAFPSTAAAMPAGILLSESKRQRNIRAGNKNSLLRDRDPSPQPLKSQCPDFHKGHLWDLLVGHQYHLPCPALQRGQWGCSQYPSRTRTAQGNPHPSRSPVQCCVPHPQPFWGWPWQHGRAPTPHSAFLPAEAAPFCSVGHVRPGPEEHFAISHAAWSHSCLGAGDPLVGPVEVGPVQHGTVEHRLAASHLPAPGLVHATLASHRQHLTEGKR